MNTESPPVNVEIFVGKKRDPDFQFWLHIIPRNGDVIQIEGRDYAVMSCCHFMPTEKDPSHEVALTVSKMP